MHLTANLVAEALFKINELRNQICRIYSLNRENINNLDLDMQAEWSIVYKMLFADQHQQNIILPDYFYRRGI